MSNDFSEPQNENYETPEEKIEIDKEELSTFVQLLLMQKLRDICSIEFMSIIDQVLLSELDLINDY